MTKQLRNLTKQKIIDMAIVTLKQDGFDNLSMRKLAGKLGVKAAALYNHIQNKTMLVKELQLYFLDPDNRLYNINYEATTWQELITSRMESIYKETMARPYTLEIFSKYLVSTRVRKMEELLEKYLSKMVSFGFSVADAMYIHNFTGIYMSGHCNFVLGLQSQLKEYPDAMKFKPGSDALDQFTAEMQNGGEFDFDRAYNFAVQRLIEGIANLCKIK